MAQPSITAGVGQGAQAVDAALARRARLIERENEQMERKIARRESTTTVPEWVESLGESSRAQYQYGREAEAFTSVLNQHAPISTRATYAEAQAAVKAAADADAAEAAKGAAEEMRILKTGVIGVAAALAAMEQATRRNEELQTSGFKTQAEYRKRAAGAMEMMGFSVKEQAAFFERADAEGGRGMLTQQEELAFLEASAQGFGGIATSTQRAQALDTLDLARAGRVGISRAMAAARGPFQAITRVTTAMGASRVGMAGSAATRSLAELDARTVTSETGEYESGLLKEEMRIGSEAFARESPVGALAETFGFNALARYLVAKAEIDRREMARNFREQQKIEANTRKPPPSLDPQGPTR